MCGIVGYAAAPDLHLSRQLERATESLHHRGPDDGALLVQNVGCMEVGLGHRRLAVIDLSPDGAQPMKVPGGQCIAFNGEIYNYKTVRQELETLGVRFKSSSDTEVLLQAYNTWGDSCLRKLVGMFAFALLDPARQILILARDRMGVKPLYFSFTETYVVFGSELRVFSEFGPISKKINPLAVADFLTRGYIGEQHSILSAVQKVLPGELIQISMKDLQIERSIYWSPSSSYLPKVAYRSIDAAADALDEILVDAVSLRLVSDVPVGIFLSGGYDSSLVAAIVAKRLAQPIECFTIGFDDRTYDESHHAFAVSQALSLPFRKKTCTAEDARALIPLLPEIFDEPFGDSSAIPTLLVSAFARSHVTVALSADGGDELFGGYRKYVNALRLTSAGSRLPNIPRPLATALAQLLPHSLLRKIFRREINKDIATKAAIIVLSGYSTVQAAELINQSTFDENLIERIVPSHLQSRNENKHSAGFLDERLGPIDQLLAADVRGYLVSDILVKVDRASMAYSLEAREPLLDHRLFEFAAALPEKLKISHERQTKVVLKHLTHRYLPKQIMDRPKMGFGVPVVDWMRGPLRPLLTETLAGNGLDLLPADGRDAIRRIYSALPRWG
jgi:asparagine synthase (glutamine-hydrolysing)